MFKFTYTATADIHSARIRDLLVSAFEGGIGYWAFTRTFGHPGLEYPADFEDTTKIKAIDPEFEIVDPVCPRYEISPLLPDGYVRLGPVDPYDIWPRERPDGSLVNDCLNRESIAYGLKIMADKYPRHFDNVLKENDDAETGDVFVQCCLFGEVVFG